MNEKWPINFDVTNQANQALISIIKEYGWLHYEEVFDNFGVQIKILIYEYESKTYLIRYYGDMCVMFRDITAKPRHE